MDLGLKGRTALVCGASSGLALASAEALAEEGANVTMFARRRDILEREADRLGALEVLWERDVAADGERTDPVGLAFDHVAPPREHRHVRAFLGQRFSARERQPGGGAADEGGAPFQPKVHGSPR